MAQAERERFIQDWLNAERQIKDLKSQRDALNLQILQLENYSRDLRALIAQDAVTERTQAQSSLGLRDAILIILRNSNAPMSTVEIRDALLAAGYSFGAFRNHMAAIHNTLRRMQGVEVAFVKNLNKFVLIGS